MISRLIRRAAAGVVTIACVYVVTFLMAVSIPGNPFQTGERNMPREAEQALRVRYHMDSNWRYFWEFLAGALRFDFGPTFTYNEWTCNQVIAASLPVSVMVGSLAIAVAIMVGVPLGVLGAVHRNTWRDTLSTTLILWGVSIPTFVTGSVLLIVFAVYLKIAPVGGWGTVAHLPLPVLTLSLPFIAYIARLTRAGMLDVLGSDFIRTALAKGLSRRVVIWKHAFKPAFLPVLSYLGPAIAQAVTGSFVVEKVFGVPGIGQHFVNAALNRDSALIMSTVLVFATMLVAFNIIVDALYAWIDPRIYEAL
jgi:oligopeptide transport system permease protein